MRKSEFVVSVLKRELAKLEKQLIAVKAKCDDNPASELFELLKEAKTRFDSGEDRFSPEFLKWVNESAAKETKLRKQMKSEANGGTQKHWDKRLEIETHIGELNNAIHYN